MKRLFFITFIALLLSGCSDESEIVVGYTPGYGGQNLPITLLFGKDGFSFRIDGLSINTPIGTFSITDYSFLNTNKHTTFVQLIDEKDNIKKVFDLGQNGFFQAETQGETTITIEDIGDRASTVVSIRSQEITNYIHKQNNDNQGEYADSKPSFPDVIIPHWCIIKKYNEGIDWSIHNFWDFFSDIFLGIIWLFVVCLDLFLIILDISMRFIAFIFILIWYAISSFWR